MQRRHNLTHCTLVGIVVLGLIPLIVVVDAQPQIAFVSERDGNPEIYVMDVDGKNQRRLTNNSDGDTSPSWSPDGNRIAFASDRDGHVDAMHGLPTYEIYVMNPNGDNPQNLTNSPHYDMSPSWSPDGKRIAFASNRFSFDGEKHFLSFDICVMDNDGKNLQRLTENRQDDRDPSWSPDGKRIVFRARRDGHVENRFAVTYEIYVMDNDGVNEQRLTENRKNDLEPVWSPDGKRIAFVSDRKGNFEHFDVYVMDADGGNQQQLTHHRAWDRNPSWSPDSKRIAFMSERDGNREIYVMDNSGEHQKNLTNNPDDDWNPAWLNSPFAVSPRGKEFTVWGRLKQFDR